MHEMWERFKEKDDTMNRMWWDFYKELSMVKSMQGANKMNDDQLPDYILVTFFNECEGLDDEITQTLNMKLKFVMGYYSTALGQV